MKKQIIFLTLLIFGCSTTDLTKIETADELFKKAKKEYTDENYLDAIETFKELLLRFPANTIADDAQFYLAECRYKRAEYVLAASEYDYLIKTMPSSNFVDYANYKKAISYWKMSPIYPLDQKYTVLAIDELQNFVETTKLANLKSDAEKRILQLNDKLAKKIYESSLIYYKMHYYRSAITYCDLLTEKYPDSKYINYALLVKAKSFFEREKSKLKTSQKDFSKSLKVIDELKEKQINSEIEQETEFLLTSIKENQKQS
ncbi:MAG: outer membrane protein assembly factor BamD [Bacteroidetes bacterium]|nr:outer membrane protein assembly factor BamD [Bacteroidota bacterium]